MKTIRGRRFEHETVTLDGFRYIGCTFVDCSIRFAGGHTSIADCLFVRPQMEFSADAANTVELLSSMGMLKQNMHTVPLS